MAYIKAPIQTRRGALSLFLGGLGESKNAALRKLYAGVTLSLFVTAVLIVAVLVASGL